MVDSAEILDYDEVEPIEIKDFLSDFATNDSNLVFYLYEMVRGKKEFLEKFEDEAPSIDDIAEFFGSGKYQIMATDKTTRKGRTISFTISEKNRHSRKRTETTQNGTIAQQPIPNDQQTFLNGLKELLAVSMPFIMPIIQKQQNTSLQLSKSMDEMMRQNLMANLNFYQTTQDTMVKRLETAQRQQVRSMNQYEEEEEMIEEKQDLATRIITAVLPMVENFLPQLLNGGVGGGAIKTMVKSTAEYKELRNDTEALEKVVSYLIQEKGEDTTKKILSALDIPIGS